MPDERASRAELLGALEREMRKTSAYSVLFSHAVAERVGMNSTDMECLDILGMTGPITAGRLAELTGLTTGAITGLVDRLERVGYVRREKDPRDRRKVIIQPLTEKAERELVPLFASMAATMYELSTRYTDQELALILDFATRANVATQEEIARVRDGAPGRPPAQAEEAAP